MSDIPAQPPSPSPIARPAAQAPDIQQAPVTSSPPQSTETPDLPLHLEGKVIAQDKATGETRISTSGGDITINTKTPLPTETKVTVDLYLLKEKMHADVTVQRQTSSPGATPPETAAAVKTETAQIEKPPASVPLPPPLKAGDTVTALLLLTEDAPHIQNSATPVKNAPPQPLPLKQVALIITALRQATVDLSQLPVKLPFPIETAQKIFTAPHILQTLQSLPPQVQAQVIDFISNPAVLTFVKNTLQAQNIPFPISPSSSETALINTAPETQATTPTLKPDILLNAVKKLFPFLQNTAQKIQASAIQNSNIGPAAPDTPEHFETNLSNVLRAQIGVKVAQNTLHTAPTTNHNVQSPQSTKTAPPPSPHAVLAMLEQAKPQNTPLTTFLQQFLSAKDTPLFLQAPKSSPLPQNIHQIKIISITPPATTSTQQAPSPSSPPLPTTQTLPQQTGTIESITPRGFPIIKTESGQHFVLKEPIPVALNSKVIFTARLMTPEQILGTSPLEEYAPTGKAAEKLFTPFTAKTWPALEETLEWIQQTTPQTAQNIQNTLPSPSPRMASTTLLFLAMLRMGDVENWLGPQTLQTLRNTGKGKLADRLTGDFSKISTQSQETLPGGWKMTTIPMLYDDALNQMQLFVRQQYEKGANDDDEGSKSATRFILNLSLSRMGNMQLDGFIRQKDLNIVLRTRDKLDFDIRQDIMKHFAIGIEHANLQGSISFQTQSEKWVTIDASDAPAQSGSTLA